MRYFRFYNSKAIWLLREDGAEKQINKSGVMLKDWHQPADINDKPITTHVSREEAGELTKEEAFLVMI